MVDPDRLERFLRTKLRDAGRQYERARRAYTDGQTSVLDEPPVPGPIPTDEAGRARIVCRRYAERRAVELDTEHRPNCFEAGHVDCEGCVEDIRAGTIEVWED